MTNTTTTENNIAKAIYAFLSEKGIKMVYVQAQFDEDVLCLYCDQGNLYISANGPRVTVESEIGIVISAVEGAETKKLFEMLSDVVAYHAGEYSSGQIRFMPKHGTY